MSVTVELDEDVLAEAGVSADELGIEVRLEVALALYRRDVVSAGKAAELAGVSRGEMEGVLTERGMRHEYTEEDLEMDLGVVSELAG